MQRRTPIERLMERVEMIPIGGCWIWTGPLNKDGYGPFFIEGRNAEAHRVAFLLLRGEIGEGLVLDHLCRNPCCVNPHHLEPVTLAENFRRGTRPIRRPQRQPLREKCANGHEMSEDNIYRYKHLAYCKACIRTASREARRRKTGYYEKHNRDRSETGFQPQEHHK